MTTLENTKLCDFTSINNNDFMCTLMTHKYRGCIAVFSREVKPNLLIRHKGSQRIFISLNN